ncbi:uncharacterized protein V1510DRAFT_404085 [Dipodascopsis tothii]|uniref:uncharacterized protein n=1 Tax=Dipodascopsis tothii TaxID=44089 RepID=UPI0034CD3B7C
MGVHGLWQILGPVARPVKLETLHGKRLAVDASIWIYHFLKAVRDKQGNALPNSHIVGFFRRICKLLYHGIQPVFVFDGGAPALKMQTIASRKNRRQDREDDTHRTANKLLSLQLQKLAEEEVRGKRAGPEETMYFEELQLSKEDLVKSRQTTAKRFIKMDPYHLPDQENKPAASDPRMMSEEDLERYATEFSMDDESGLYDTSNIDFESPEFDALPITLQYQLLNTARLRSRLRMGYSKEQLEQIFPDRLEFSKFQIERVRERNMLTQRLMHLLGMTDDLPQRVAGEKDTTYMLKRNDSGWTLALDDKAPIRVDESSESEDEWEDVSIAKGPKKGANGRATIQIARNRPLPPAAPADRPLFELDAADQEQLYNELEDDAELTAAIEMSLEREPEDGPEETPAKPPEEKPQAAPEIPLNMENPFVFEGTELAQLISKVLKKDRTGDEPAGPDDEPAASAGPADPAPAFTVPQLDFSRSMLKKRKAAEPETLAQTQPAETRPAEAKPARFDLSQINVASSMLSRKKARTQPSVLQPDEEVAGPAEPQTARPAEAARVRFASPVASAAASPASPAAPAAIKVEDSDDDFEDFDISAAVAAPPGAASSGSAHAPPAPASALSPSAVPILVKDDDDESDDEEDIAPDEEVEDAELRTALVSEIREHARFASSLKGPVPTPQGSTLVARPSAFKSFDRVAPALPVPAVNEIGYNTSSYDDEIAALRSQQKNNLRDSETVTQNMVRECQELLARFGIPYITAPMEAEAQCAELMRLGLVDGIVTDDSDVFLFGAERVYKNMFNQAKYVECYLTKDIQKDLHLGQQELIRLALLLGSDYTAGVPGVGPVTAKQLINEFGSLVEFRDWYRQIQAGEAVDASTPFRKRFKKKSKKLFLDPAFPDPLVEEAYVRPEVDSDKTQFVWGVPDLDRIRAFLMSTIGWSQERADEMLVPVLKNMNSKKQSLVFRS